MSFRWRLGLLLVAAAAVVAGFMPHAALASAERGTTEMAQAAQSPLLSPTQCFDAACGKGSAAPAAPVPGVALAAMIGGVAVAALTGLAIRRHRRRLAALPAGSRDPLFHPPQFS